MSFKAIFFGLIIATVGISIYIHNRMSFLDEPITQSDTPIRIEVAKGMSFKQLVARLAQRKVISDGTVFELFARFSNQDRAIKAGHYLIRGDITPRRLLKELTQGQPEKSVRVTLPEGWNRWQIADRLTELKLVNRDRFLRRVELERLEGRLFPDTYRFAAKADTDGVIDRLLSRHNSVWTQIKLRGHEQPTTFSDDELINMASMAQKESGHLDEQRKIIRVFLNRLKKGMKLQSDPTCVYDSRLYKTKPSPATCKDKENPYSTYVIRGLPPTPIGNPGASALKAAMHPFDGTRADKILFFVARRDGSKRHYFSETYQEHKAAVERYLKEK
ncbi:MAG: endolytic transglycosylase MltG [Myxococcota bacterium]|nr:endolytic transglycosylase MltG [Myxococcota bacterium]